MKSILAFALLYFGLAIANANTVGLRGGGSECVLRFIKFGKVIEKNLHAFPVDQFKLKEVINNANIVSVESEYIVIDGEQFYAINEPEKMKISLSQKWCNDSLNSKLANTAIIVLHEYLGLSQPLFDKNYYISIDFFNLTNLTPEEFYDLASSDGNDTAVVTSQVFTKPTIINPLELKLTGSLLHNQTANLICNRNKGSYLYLHSKAESSPVTNTYVIKSYNYCVNKIKEFVTGLNENSGMSFVIGLDSSSVYEINIEKN